MVFYYNRNLYFGNDNDEFLCTDLDGNQFENYLEMWSKPTLIKRKNGNIVFATEVGEVRAVSPKMEIVLNYFIPN